MFTASEALTVYTDGSFIKAPSVPDRSAYGWVCREAPAAFARARVVCVPLEAIPATYRNSNQSQRMESAAIVDAIAEFAPLGRRLRVVTDCKSLVEVITRYQAGELPRDFFLQAPQLIFFADAVKLTRLLATVEVEMEWVKGHSGVLENTVVDQMLRQANIKGLPEAAAVAWAEKALSTGKFVARQSLRGKNGEWRTTEALFSA